MDNVNLLPQENRPQHGHITDRSGKDALIVANLDGKIVNLEAMGHVSNASAVAIGVGQHNNLKQCEADHKCYFFSRVSLILFHLVSQRQQHL